VEIILIIVQTQRKFELKSKQKRCFDFHDIFIERNKTQVAGV